MVKESSFVGKMADHADAYKIGIALLFKGSVVNMDSVAKLLDSAVKTLPPSAFMEVLQHMHNFRTSHPPYLQSS